MSPQTEGGGTERGQQSVSVEVQFTTEVQQIKPQYDADGVHFYWFMLGSENQVIG